MPGTPNDPNRPVNPGPPPAKRAQMRDAVQDVMKKVAADKEAERQETVAKHKKDQKRGMRGVILVACGVVALTAALMWAVPAYQHPFPARTGAAADRDARIAILFTAKMVDNFEAQHHRLPISLQDAGIALPGLVYTSSATSYTITAMVGDQKVMFVSTMNRNAFRDGH